MHSADLNALTISALQFSSGFIFSDRKKSTSFISDCKISIIRLANFALLDLWLTKTRFVSLIGMSSVIRLVRCGSAFLSRSFTTVPFVGCLRQVPNIRVSAAGRQRRSTGNVSALNPLRCEVAHIRYIFLPREQARERLRDAMLRPPPASAPRPQMIFLSLRSSICAGV